MPRHKPSAVPAVPTERSSTLRQQLHAVLRDGSPRTAHQLSEELGVSEREIAPHLEHLERSLKKERERLVVEPPECGACGFVFRERHRLTRPGKCPRCRATRVSAPRFRITAGAPEQPPRRRLPMLVQRRYGVASFAISPSVRTRL